MEDPSKDGIISHLCEAWQGRRSAGRGPDGGLCLGMVLHSLTLQFSAVTSQNSKSDDEDLP